MVGNWGGLHQVIMDLIISQPKESFNNERMLNMEGLVSGENEIHSILPQEGKDSHRLSERYLVLGGGADGILGPDRNQTTMPGLVTSLAKLERNGEEWPLVFLQAVS